MFLLLRMFCLTDMLLANSQSSWDLLEPCLSLRAFVCVCVYVKQLCVLAVNLCAQNIDSISHSPNWHLCNTYELCVFTRYMGYD